MAQVVLKDIVKSFGALDVIKGVSLTIEDGEFVVFVGPSGCGKSTLLRMIAGLEDISDGELYIDNQICNDIAARDRAVAMVFQSYALYPHMSVYDNVGFALKLSNLPKAEIDEKVREAARILQMEPLLERKPAHLSGGQRQRVAIGRAIVRNPKVFLFDEPLSNLDAALRVDMRMEIARLHQNLDTTMIYVTHDQIEAMTLADRIVVLDRGMVRQVGAPLELYHEPANLFVAGFIGSPRMNHFPVQRAGSDDGRIEVSSQDVGKTIFHARDGAGATGGSDLTLGVRPQAMRATGPDGARIKGKVDIVEHFGDETVVNVSLPSGGSALAVVPGSATLRPGDPIGLNFEIDRAHLFDESGERIAVAATSDKPS